MSTRGPSCRGGWFQGPRAPAWVDPTSGGGSGHSVRGRRGFGVSRTRSLTRGPRSPRPEPLPAPRPAPLPAPGLERPAADASTGVTGPRRSPPRSHPRPTYSRPEAGPTRLQTGKNRGSDLEEPLARRRSRPGVAAGPGRRRLHRQRTCDVHGGGGPSSDRHLVHLGFRTFVRKNQARHWGLEAGGGHAWMPKR